MYRVLLLYTKRIPSVILCARLQLKYLKLQNQIELDENTVFKVSKKQCEKCDIAIIVRASSRSEYILIRYLKSIGKKIVYVLDDDLLQVPQYSSSYDYFQEMNTRNSIEKLIAIADIFVSPSEFLIKKYAVGKKAVHIKEVVENIDKYQRTVNSIVRIGFAGSQDRTFEFEEILSEVIKRVKKKYGKNVEIECIGIVPVKCNQYLDNSFMYQNNYEDYLHFIKERRWSIGLAPLMESEFNKYKYYNKYIEYGRFGIIGVFSDVIPYSNKIKNNETGFLVSNNADSWFEAIDSLIKNELVGNNQFIRECIFKDLKENYYVNKCAEEYYEQIIAYCGNADGVKCRMLDWWKVKLSAFGVKFADGFMRKIRKYIT